jgi:hypothetical protein
LLGEWPPILPLSTVDSSQDTLAVFAVAVIGQLGGKWGSSAGQSSGRLRVLVVCAQCSRRLVGL